MSVSNSTSSNGGWFGGVFSQSSSSTSEETSEGDNDNVDTGFTICGTTENERLENQKLQSENQELHATKQSLETRVAELTAQLLQFQEQNENLIKDNRAIQAKHIEETEALKELNDALDVPFYIPGMQVKEWKCDTEEELKAFTRFHPQVSRLSINTKDLKFRSQVSRTRLGWKDYKDSKMKAFYSLSPAPLTHLEMTPHSSPMLVHLPKTLKVLRLREMHISDDGFESLGNHHDLNKLELIDCKIYGEFLLPKNLEVLSLCNVTIDRGSTLPSSLISLKIVKNSKSTSSDLQFHHLDGLKTLVLIGPSSPNKHLPASLETLILNGSCCEYKGGSNIITLGLCNIGNLQDYGASSWYSKAYPYELQDNVEKLIHVNKQTCLRYEPDQFDGDRSYYCNENRSTYLKNTSKYKFGNITVEMGQDRWNKHYIEGHIVDDGEEKPLLSEEGIKILKEDREKKGKQLEISTSYKDIQEILDSFTIEI